MKFKYGKYEVWVYNDGFTRIASQTGWLNNFFNPKDMAHGIMYACQWIDKNG